jgi:hypothetical protein
MIVEIIQGTDDFLVKLNNRYYTVSKKHHFLLWLSIFVEIKNKT